MTKKNQTIYIIGAGISGLIAARVLEEHGFSPLIFEATDRAGGRVKTDIINGHFLDHGFQVLLTSYPAAQHYLDYDALELKTFLPGASIFKNGKQSSIGDPLRDLSLLIPTVFSTIGSLSDKLKILKLNLYLKQKELTAIFSEKEQTTYSYLKAYGFSEAIITNFFKPFFSGIFLENKLETSSRMFEFVYKMFGEGDAAIPKLGMEAIPKQLQQSLKNTKFQFHTKVMSISDGEIILNNGDCLKGDAIIVATDASHLVPGTDLPSVEWKSCETFYFETSTRVITKNLIGLLPEAGALVNNINYLINSESNPKSSKPIISVTVVDSKNMSHDDLLEQVKQELKQYCNIECIGLLKHFSIPMALPNLTNLKYELTPAETKISDTVFLAGDTLLNGSLNAAMIAGERAALGAVKALSS